MGALDTILGLAVVGAGLYYAVYYILPNLPQQQTQATTPITYTDPYATTTTTPVTDTTDYTTTDTTSDTTTTDSTAEAIEKVYEGLEDILNPDKDEDEDDDNEPDIETIGDLIRKSVEDDEDDSSSGVKTSAERIARLTKSLSSGDSPEARAARRKKQEEERKIQRNKEIARGIAKYPVGKEEGNSPLTFGGYIKYQIVTKYGLYNVIVSPWGEVTNKYFE